MSNRRNSIRMESYKDEEKILKYKTQYQKNVKAARKLKVKIVSAKAKKGKKAVLKWKKIKNVNGYQIRYSTKKNFKGKTKTLKVKNYKTVKRTIKKLKAGKKYYIQIRSFKKIKNRATGKTAIVYGKWSGTKSLKARR